MHAIHDQYSMCAAGVLVAAAGVFAALRVQAEAACGITAPLTGRMLPARRRRGVRCRLCGGGSMVHTQVWKGEAAHQRRRRSATHTRNSSASSASDAVATRAGSTAAGACCSGLRTYLFGSCTPVRAVGAHACVCLRVYEGPASHHAIKREGSHQAVLEKQRDGQRWQGQPKCVCRQAHPLHTAGCDG